MATAHVAFIAVFFHHLTVLIARVLCTPLLHVLMHLVHVFLAFLAMGITVFPPPLRPCFEGRALVRVRGTPLVELRGIPKFVVHAPLYG